MRTLKFRAFIKNTIGGFMIPSENSDCFMVSNGSDFVVYDENKNTLHDSQFHIMQFTGKQDKNGNDIYDGDIVEITTNHSGGFKPTVLRYLIVYNEDGFQGCNLIKKYKIDYLKQEVLHRPKRFNYKEWDCMKIIGNIHQNKKMLNNAT